MSNYFLAEDLFAGPGGWDVAAASLGEELRGYEYDAHTVATRSAAGLATVAGDVREVEPIHSTARGLIASPPCQTFSLAGKRSGLAEIEALCDLVRAGVTSGDTVDGRSALVLEPMRWIKERFEDFRPFEFICLEQVPAVLPIWEAYCEWLEANGYSVDVAQLNARNYGVPNARRRAILIASREKAVTLTLDTPHRLSFDKALGLEGEWTYVSAQKGAAGPNGEWQRGVRYTGDFAFSPTRTSLNDRLAPGHIDPPRHASEIERRITASELGIIQSFPADYPWQGPQASQALQIANAIPPLLAQSVLLDVL